MDRTLSLEFARVVEAAALRSGRLLGRGQKDEADGLAVDAMRQAFDSVLFPVPLLLVKVKSTKLLCYILVNMLVQAVPEVDIAVDPIEARI